ncbi:MAG: glycosyltransferase family 2 protein [Bacilli bacterium]|nr:glycosyltransferase family 2 protein [Bacilli bacterium]
MKLSIIVPLYNEEDVIEKFYKEISKTLENKKYELLFINDGSKDDSLNILKHIHENDKECVKIISFSRNFGKEAAIYAGLKASSGKYTVIIDADLQQNPKYILEMEEILDKESEYDEVCMFQKQTKKRKKQTIFYKLISKITKIDFVNGASDFRMFRRYVVDAILEMTEVNRFSKGIFSWIGFNVKYIPYVPEERKGGETKWKFKDLVRYGINGIIGFSTSPLKISTYLGVFTSFIAFGYLMFLLIKTLVTGVDVPGYASTICCVLILGGIQLLCTGILGEYVSKTYVETKKRPIYLTKEKIGFDENIL